MFLVSDCKITHFQSDKEIFCRLFLKKSIQRVFATSVNRLFSPFKPYVLLL